MGHVKNRSWYTFTFVGPNKKRQYAQMQAALRNGWWQPPQGFHHQWNDAALVLNANCSATEFNAWSAAADAGKAPIGKTVNKQECGVSVVPDTNSKSLTEQHNLF